MQEVGWRGEKIIGTQIFILEVWGGLFYTASEGALPTTSPCSQSILHPLLSCWVPKLLLKKLKLVFSMSESSAVLPVPFLTKIADWRLDETSPSLGHVWCTKHFSTKHFSTQICYFICLLPMESFASGFLRWKENVLFSLLCTKAQIFLFLLTASQSIGQF